jgi:hypothetical protein
VLYVVALFLEVAQEIVHICLFPISFRFSIRSSKGLIGVHPISSKGFTREGEGWGLADEIKGRSLPPIGFLLAFPMSLSDEFLPSPLQIVKI